MCEVSWFRNRLGGFFKRKQMEVGARKIIKRQFWVPDRKKKFYLELKVALDSINLPRLWTGTAKSTRASKICSPRRGLHCTSLTRGWIFLSLYKTVVDYFSPTAFNPHNRTPSSQSKTTSKHFLVRKWHQLGFIMTLCHCMIHGVTRCSFKRSCISRGR